MIKNPVILAAGIVLLSSVALAQQQFDSLGSPTPAPNQAASPTATTPNVPMPGDKSGTNATTTSKPATDGTGSSTTGTSAPQQPSSKGGASNPDPTGVNGTTPGGLTPD